VVAAPLEAVFDGKPGLPPVITINYRTNEAVYLKREGNNVAVIFSINFKDKDDIVIGKVFLQELEAARKTINNAPAVTFSQRERPLELKSVQNVYEGEDQGFVTFCTSPRSSPPLLSCRCRLWARTRSTRVLFAHAPLVAHVCRGTPCSAVRPAHPRVEEGQDHRHHPPLP
jgi:hypothetical protein